MIAIETSTLMQSRGRQVTLIDCEEESITTILHGVLKRYDI